MTVEGVLKKAILKEIEAQKLYLNLRHKVTKDTGRDMFRQLVEIEKSKKGCCINTCAGNWAKEL